MRVIVPSGVTLRSWPLFDSSTQRKLSPAIMANVSPSGPWSYAGWETGFFLIQSRVSATRFERAIGRDGVDAIRELREEHGRISTVLQDVERSFQERHCGRSLIVSAHSASRRQPAGDDLRASERRSTSSRTTMRTTLAVLPAKSGIGVATSLVGLEKATEPPVPASATYMRAVAVPGHSARILQAAGIELIPGELATGDANGHWRSDRRPERDCEQASRPVRKANEKRARHSARAHPAERTVNHRRIGQSPSVSKRETKRYGTTSTVAIMPKSSCDRMWQW